MHYGKSIMGLRNFRNFNGGFFKSSFTKQCYLMKLVNRESLGCSKIGKMSRP